MDVQNYEYILQSLKSDIIVPVFKADCRTLGIISKFVTGPLAYNWERQSHDGHERV